MVTAVTTAQGEQPDDVLRRTKHHPGCGKSGAAEEAAYCGSTGQRCAAQGQFGPRGRGGNQAAKGRKRAATAPKTTKILALLGRPRGASVKELMKATGWRPHSVRGFLSGVVAKRMGLKIRSTQDESGERRYTLKS